MASRGQDIVSVIKQQIEQFGETVALVDVGTVIEAGDGIARIHGLSGARYGELLQFPNEIMGIVLNLEEDSVASRLAEPVLAPRRHLLESMRRHRPYVLSEPEERLMGELANTGRNAWGRLFEETLAGIRGIKAYGAVEEVLGAYEEWCARPA